MLAFIFFQPGLKPKLFTDDEIRYKCSIEFRPTEMHADKGSTDEVLVLSQHSGKPPVRRSSRNCGILQSNNKSSPFLFNNYFLSLRKARLLQPPSLKSDFRNNCIIIGPLAVFRIDFQPSCGICHCHTFI